MNSRAWQNHSDLASKISETQTTPETVGGGGNDTGKKLDQMQSTLQVKLAALQSSAENTSVSIMSLRSRGEQIFQFLSTLPRDIRDLLNTIVQADRRTYQAVLQIQQRLAKSPICQHDSNIQFTNVLGEYREFPYEYFC